MRQVFARAISGLAVIGLVAGAAACNSSSGDDDSASGGNCGYKLAYFGALTGSSANLGVNIEQGFELAINQYNEKKGSDCITVAKFDSQGEPAVAPGVARQLVADKKILGIVGPPFSGESEAADPIFEEAGIPTISPSATRVSLAANGWKTFHRAVANDDSQGPAAAAYIKDTLKAAKVFVADDQSAYGAGLADIVKKTLGSAVVNSDKTEADGKQTDFSAVVQKVVSSGATVMFYGGYYQNAGLIRKQLTAAGWKGTLVGGDGMKDAGLAKAAGNAAAVGTIVTCPCSPPEKAGGTFVTDYKAKWGVDAGTYSDVAFDAANIYLQGIDAGNTTAEKMNTFLSTVNYQGIANTYKFTETGELDPSLIKVWTFKFDATGNQVADQEVKVTP
ncbi:branched-chain amino acid ABC transporter substrate-binding protein [Actinoplanes sp. RD1]|uniref:branched-chain amino acid ABC transporter substrate-binding protein n=1 Tax=Actinoplanes sp. RD1 TaxID=3064538 RepID=UPI002740472A|nr:branched-chain amino acid ABC transporter substrate-binding protein [Actinoplanes sp. RD1]